MNRNQKLWIITGAWAALLLTAFIYWTWRVRPRVCTALAGLADAQSRLQKLETQQAKPAPKDKPPNQQALEDMRLYAQWRDGQAERVFAYFRTGDTMLERIVVASYDTKPTTFKTSYGDAYERCTDRAQAITKRAALALPDISQIFPKCPWQTQGLPRRDEFGPASNELCIRDYIVRALAQLETKPKTLHELKVGPPDTKSYPVPTIPVEFRADLPVRGVNSLLSDLLKVKEEAQNKADEKARKYPEVLHQGALLLLLRGFSIEPAGPFRPDPKNPAASAGLVKVNMKLHVLDLDLPPAPARVTSAKATGRE